MSSVYVAAVIYDLNVCFLIMFSAVKFQLIYNCFYLRFLHNTH